jgi:hypothetical protein
MPFSIRLDPDSQMVVISLQGEIGDEDLIALSRTARAYPEVGAGIDVLYDCSAVTTLAVSRELIQQLGTRARDDTNRVAFIASTPVAYGLARMYQIISGGEERMLIFDNEAAAMAWLKGA